MNEKDQRKIAKVAEKVILGLHGVMEEATVGGFYNLGEVLRSIIYRSHDGTVVLDRDGNVEMINPAFQRITGLSENTSLEEFRNFFGENLIIPMTVSEIKNRVRYFEREIANASGQKIYISISHYFIYDAIGEIQNVIYTFRDITKRMHEEEDATVSERIADLSKLNQELLHELSLRKLAEENLRRWDRIFENAKWGIVITSGEGNLLEMMNPAFARMHGYTVAELTGKPIMSIYAPESRGEIPEQLR